MAKYIYEGNRDAGNTATQMEYDGNTYPIGSEIELSSAKAHQLADYVVLRNSGGNEVDGDGEADDRTLDFSAPPTDTVPPSPEADVSDPPTSGESEGDGKVSNKTGSSKKS